MEEDMKVAGLKENNMVQEFIGMQMEKKEKEFGTMANYQKTTKNKYILRS
jgi:hypothetical protein